MIEEGTNPAITDKKEPPSYDGGSINFHSGAAPGPG